MVKLLKLLRWPNLLIIIFTQYLIRYCVILPVFSRFGVQAVMTNLDFLLLVVSTVLIAGAGNIINDILDLEIDRKNKPDQLIIERLIDVNLAKKWYVILNVLGIIAGEILAIRSGFPQLGVIFILVSFTLYLYSYKWKKLPVMGNILISYLSAAVVGIIWLFEYFFLRNDPVQFTGMINNWTLLNLLIPGYMLFAFLLSWSREIIKDIEDIDGDRAFGCTSMPIRFGISVSKWISLSIVGGTVFLLAYSHVRLTGMAFSPIAWYYSTIVQFFVLLLGYLLYTAKETTDYHFASTINKLAMLTGVLGAIGFKFYL
ncbi:MAG: geranylgeranylglycerol-phosphate geranylgeranyltransferase [Bacteroidales bacterium]|nr:geranylgeranylglycerol-phosphate geranylgeranyltransferase [Bacteroidales bacterium]